MVSIDRSKIWKEAKSGIIPGVISTSIFMIFIFLHFLWKFYFFQNIPWTLIVVAIGIIGISVLLGSFLGLILGATNGLLDNVLPKDKVKRIITFPLLITLIIAPLILWKMIWGRFMILYIFLSLVFWTVFKIKLGEESNKQKKGNSLLLGMAFMILISIGTFNFWFEHATTTPDKVLGDVTLSGVVGNSNLTGGFTQSGKMSLLSWPSPSHYEHVDYLGKRKKSGVFEAKGEMGVFSGVYVGGEDSVSWFWGENWEHSHYYRNSSSNVLNTVSKNSNFGLKVNTSNFVLPNENVLVRNYELEKEENSGLENFTFFSYSNFHPTTGKIPFFPFSDYFQSQPVLADFPMFRNSRTAYFEDNCLVFSKKKSPFQKNDKSKDTVYLGVTSSSKIGDYQIGTLNDGNPKNAFDDCDDGKLSNSSSATGKVNGAFSTKLDSEDNSITLYYAVSGSEERTLNLLNNARKKPYSTQSKNNENWWNDWLQKASLPATNNENILEVAKRSLITIRNAYDKNTGAILASVSRQPPYFLDWPRDGAFMNYALDQAGYHEMVTKHNQFYADIQRATGTWEMNYFSDGTEGGPLLFEIDETGLTIWSMWKHYEMTGNQSYLENVYPSIKKAANFLSSWKSPSNNLQFYAQEDDSLRPTQTIQGASTVCLGLKSAIKAGQATGENKNTLQKWKKRTSELEKGIEEQLWNPEKGEYKGPRNNWAIWPAKLENFDNPKMKSQAEIVWDEVSRSINADRVGESDAYEIGDILSIAHIWTDNEMKKNKLKKSLEWWAEDIASQDTNQFGEFHYTVREDNNLVWKNKVAIPHVWNHALFYSSAMKVYGAENKQMKN